MKLPRFLAFCLVSLLAEMTEAAIAINSQQTFNSAPPVANWSTRSIPQTAGTTPGGSETTTAAQMDAIIQTNTAAMINSAVIDDAGTPAANLARRNAPGNFLYTRATGNTATILMATLTNSSPANISYPFLAYDLGIPNAIAGEDAELAGHRVYYSLTGLADSWVLIPELSTVTPVAGPVYVTLSLGTWAANSLMYVIWVDDNGGGGGDGSYSIDNFLVSPGLPHLVIDQQPVSITVTQGLTLRLSVAATGAGLQYAWNKVGTGPIDPVVNPSAITADLVINNVQASDAGQYFVTINDWSGGVQSATATVTYVPDTFAPRLLKLELVSGDLRAFRVVVDSALCQDPGACLAFSGDAWNWQIQDTATFTDLFVNGVTNIGTNVYITTDIARTPGVTYRVAVVQAPPNGGVADLFGNFVPFGTFVESLPTVSFQQGVDGYAGTQDAELHSVAGADMALGAATTVSIDNDDAGVAQGLLRFDNIIGNGAGKVPPGALIVSAVLTLNQTDPGSPANFHRMLVPWDQSTVTWNSMVEGVTNDGVEAVIASDGISINEQVNAIPHVINVTASVKAWASGQANHGWGIRSTGNGGWDWNTSESGPTTAPLLTIEYRCICDYFPPIFISQPPATTGTEGGSVSITAGVMTFGNTTYQWTKNNVDVGGQTSSTLSLVNLAMSDAGQYRLRVTNPIESATSAPATLTVIADTNRPVVYRVVSVNPTTIVVIFSKIMGGSAAVLAGHYILSPSGSVTGASVSADGRTVTLTTMARNFTTAYSLRIQDVFDNRATPNPLSPNPTIVSPTTVQSVIAWNDGNPWSYATNSQDDTLTSGTPWYSPGFVPGPEWLSGAGLFGFDDTPATVAALPAPIITPLTPNAVTASPDLFVTTYFRRSITLPPLPTGGQYVLCTIIDDGAIFYLDGLPILTNNMPNISPIQFITRAFGASSEGVVQCFPLNTTSGTHTLAAEVHQAGTGNSSDVLFGLDIRILSAVGPSLSLASALGATIVSWPADSSWELTTSMNVAGPYAAQITSSVGQFSFPVPANPTNRFYRLRYTGRP